MKDLKDLKKTDKIIDLSEKNIRGFADDPCTRELYKHHIEQMTKRLLSGKEIPFNFIGTRSEGSEKKTSEKTILLDGHQRKAAFRRALIINPDLTVRCRVTTYFGATFEQRRQFYNDMAQNVKVQSMQDLLQQFRDTIACWDNLHKERVGITIANKKKCDASKNTENVIIETKNLILAIKKMQKRETTGSFYKNTIGKSVVVGWAQNITTEDINNFDEVLDFIKALGNNRLYVRPTLLFILSDIYQTNKNVPNLLERCKEVFNVNKEALFQIGKSGGSAAQIMGREAIIEMLNVNVEEENLLI